MPKTAVINPRRRRRRSTKKRRRRRYNTRSTGAAAKTVNARRRRRRRRNPADSTPIRRAYSSGGYRRKNPDTFLNIDQLIEVTPAATVGVLGARWATKLAGPMEDGEPGFKHALAIWIASGLGGQVVSNVLGDRYKGLYAMIAALGFGGDLFARKVFFKESDWFSENLYLEGFQNESVLGQVYEDAVGNKYELTEQGYVPLGQVQKDPALAPQGSQLAGFQNESVLGRASRYSRANSFGYTR